MANGPLVPWDPGIYGQSWDPDFRSRQLGPGEEELTEEELRLLGAGEEFPGEEPIGYGAEYIDPDWYEQQATYPGAEEVVIDADDYRVNGEEPPTGVGEAGGRWWQRYRRTPETPEERARRRAEELSRRLAELRAQEVEGRLGAQVAGWEKMRWQHRMATPSRLKRATKKAEEVRGAGKEVGRMSGGLYRLATLGGTPKVSKTTRDLYIPHKPPREQAIPTGMRALTAPQYGALQRATTLGPGRGAAVPTPSMPIARAAMPTGRVSSLTKPPDLTHLRRLSTYVPAGLTGSEAAAWKEIRANNDVDTRSHVVEELGKLGIPPEEASRAIQRLLGRRLVKEDRTFQGEPILQVARR